MTPRTKEFWGSQGRLGRITAGDWEGRLVFAYPDTLEGWWTYVIDPSPYPDVPGDHYEPDTEVVFRLVDDEWKVAWLPSGAEEMELERSRFGWRPLGSSVDWLP